MDPVLPVKEENPDNNQISDELNVSHQEAETIYSEVEEYIKTSQEEK